MSIGTHGVRVFPGPGYTWVSVPQPPMLDPAWFRGSPAQWIPSAEPDALISIGHSGAQQVALLQLPMFERPYGDSVRVGFDVKGSGGITRRIRPELAYGVTPTAQTGALPGTSVALGASRMTVSQEFSLSAVGSNVRYISPRISVWDDGAPPSTNKFYCTVYVSTYEGLGIAHDLSCFVDEVTVTHGRAEPDQVPDAATATIGLDLRDDVLPSWVDIGYRVIVYTDVAAERVTRFDGTITDVALGWDDVGEDTPNSGVGQVIAASNFASLGRRVVGATPFPQELDGKRVERVMSAAGVTLVPATSDPGTVQILPRDIDSVSALDAANDAAISAGGVLWHTRAGDIRYADANHRRGTVAALELDACDLLVTPTWSRNTGGLINKVSIGYGVAVDGGEQPRYLADNPASIAKFGTYDYSLTTTLATAADGQAMGDLLLARNSTPVWVMAALPVAVKDLTDADTLKLLKLEMHSLLALTGLPAIATAPTTATLWVEGWRERLAWGEHELEVNVSGYCRSAPPPRWDDVTTDKTWDNTTVTWDQVVCLGPPTTTDRWTDVPATVRWNTAKGTWDAYTGGS